MELKNLYEIQGGLKAHIDYKGKDKFDRMMLAMVIEFCEAANDWQKFKYWKKNNDPKETLLDEVSDGLHFVLEAGLDMLEANAILELPKEIFYSKHDLKNTITEQFKHIIIMAIKLNYEVISGWSYADVKYIDLFESYMSLVKMLGFTEEQLINAYMNKNRINHERQIKNY